MDMTDNSNDKLLQEFFKEARQQQIADNGFTERVMRHIDVEPLNLSRIWTWFCIFVGVVLFFVLRGWETIRIGLEVFLQTAPTEFNPLALILSLGVLYTMGIIELVRRERLSF